jgi:hypothetical protein
MGSSDLIENVDIDPELSGDEKETTINMYGQDKKYTIYSAKPTIIKKLLNMNTSNLIGPGLSLKIRLE